MFPKNLLMPLFWLVLAFIVVCFSIRVYAEFQPVNHFWIDMRGTWMTEKDYLAKIAEPVKPVVPKTVVKPIIKSVEKSLPTKATNDTFNLDKLSRAVACHETKCGTRWSALTHNNAFGIMTWDKNWKRSFKRYATLNDSYIDFKRIWSSYYGGFPTLKQAKRYSGNDRAETWLYNVKFFYSK